MDLLSYPFETFIFMFVFDTNDSLLSSKSQLDNSA